MMLDQSAKKRKAPENDDNPKDPKITESNEFQKMPSVDLVSLLPLDVNKEILNYLSIRTLSFFGMTSKTNNKYIEGLFGFSKLLFSFTSKGLEKDYILQISEKDLEDLMFISKAEANSVLTHLEKNIFTGENSEQAFKFYNLYEGYPLLYVICDLLANKRIQRDYALGFIEALLKKGADPNQMHKEIAPLHILAASFEYQAIDLLISHGADVDIYIDYLIIPLRLAIETSVTKFQNFNIDKEAVIRTIYILLNAGTEVDNGAFKRMLFKGKKINWDIWSMIIHTTYNPEEYLFGRWFHEYIFDREPLLEQLKKEDEENVIEKSQPINIFNSLEESCKKIKDLLNASNQKSINEILIKIEFYLNKLSTKLIIETETKNNLSRLLNQFCELNYSYLKTKRSKLFFFHTSPIIKKLLHLGADPNVCYNDDSQSSLYYCFVPIFYRSYSSADYEITETDYSTVRLMIKKGADLEACIKHKNKDDEPPINLLQFIIRILYKAVCSQSLEHENFFEIYSFLIKSAISNSKNSSITDLIKNENTKLSTKVNIPMNFFDFDQFYNPKKLSIEEWVQEEIKKHTEIEQHVKQSTNAMTM